MFKNKFFLVFTSVILVAIIIYSFVDSQEKPAELPKSDDNYAKTIQQIRLEKDQAFKEEKESPIEKKAEFKGLHYFEVNPAYKVVATMDMLTSGQNIKINMTGGETEEYEAFANVKFEIDGKKCALKLFKTPEGNLFLPFRDLTTNKETYGAGRYIDLKLEDIKDKTIKIDFNLCYQPYCAYNPTYTCPVPPAENFLNVALKAGERM
ncbi:DUF1684 domain-containing protein [Arcicella aquatica]|uniref:DUF1684 domain-containing protein n=1 Tax=Arcicella aquatica TaxID=217141 RepID=A0ABU5QRQ2_9BACT|nr:DUF1684 domain-containing protein [Arcicella aquatica]MEA5259772.1 DUF1684 domain-containing protein [Arcicella aquatica]